MSTLPPHIQIITRNIQLLWKSKEDAQVDATLQNEAHCFALSESILNSEDNNNVMNNDDVIRSPETTDDSISLDILYLTFSIIKNNWVQSDYQDAEDILLLVESWYMHKAPESNLIFNNVLAIQNNDHTLGTSLDFHIVHPHTL